MFPKWTIITSKKTHCCKEHSIHQILQQIFTNIKDNTHNDSYEDLVTYRTRSASHRPGDPVDSH